MKTGSSLQKLAAELERQQESKRDFIAPTTELEVVAQWNIDGEDRGPCLRVNGHGLFPINDVAHQQIASRVGIPQKYYDRMKLEAPGLMVDNVNHWFGAKKEKQMVRTLDGTARAFLSDRYRPLDNLDMATAVLPILGKMGVKVESSELTQKRLYIKAVTPKVTAEIKNGDVVQAGIIISNSEVGLGSVKVEPLVFRLVCLNGLIVNDHAMRKYHVGRSGAEGDMAAEFFRDETRQADDKAFWMKVRDVVAGAFNQDVFGRIVERMKEATERIIDVDVVKVVEVVRRDHALNDDERSGVLQHLIKGGDLTQYGLLNAVTRTSQDVPDYDRATELERTGGDILAMSGGEWEAFLNIAERTKRD
jgi:hypothetical protein